MLHWIQYLRGYVTVKVWGYSVERLLNLCGNHDVLVWNIEDHGDYHTMHISIAGFFALKPLLKKQGRGRLFLASTVCLFLCQKCGGENCLWQGFSAVFCSGA